MQKERIAIHLFPASVKTITGTKWGYINEAGKFVFPPQYEEASEFQTNGLAIVRQKGAGIINQSGNYVVLPKYSSISLYSEGRAVVMDEHGSMVVDEAGKVLNLKAYPFISSFQEQRAVFQDIVNDGQTVYGYLDLNGKPVIPARFQYANDFKDGKALVQINAAHYALINRSGKQLQTYPYEQMSGLSEGMISYKRTFQDKAGYVNEAGKVVIAPRFAFALPFRNGRAVVNASEDYKNEYGIINKSGVYVIPPKYNDIIMLGEDRAAVGRAIDSNQPFIGSIYAIADTEKGRVLTDFIYDSVNEFDGGYSSVTQGLQSFFINRDGKPASNLPVIQGIGTLSLEGNVIKAFVDQRLTYYDRNGRVIWTQNNKIPLTPSLFIREGKYRPNKDYLVYYPQMEGMQNRAAQAIINQVLKKESQVKPIDSNTPLDYSYTGDFSVKFLQKHLLVLELVGYNFPYGAAHGMPSQIEVPLNLVTGQIYELKDLFKSNSNYVKVISQIIGKKIQENSDAYFPDAYQGIAANQPFYVTKDSLAIYFQPYEIAAFAAGFPTFDIPFEEIKSLINVDGEFWRSFH
ncbi:WG repeat-containing protein [Sutcliffiella halmapala]|uniref:WG repeat-containing protein n=1 Tax=Sutcliffiella halmapala TaxID=79882 RepID=UPI0009951087|nr:WG repeat-containing protein [Sutcliffiella halmapala]